MFTDRSCMAVQESVIQSFIIGEVKSQFLEIPFHVPIDLRHKSEVGIIFTSPFYCLTPEWLDFYTPGIFKDFWKNKHGHITSHAIALI